MTAASSIGLNGHSLGELARQQPFFEPAGDNRAMRRIPYLRAAPKIGTVTGSDDFSGSEHAFLGDDSNKGSFNATRLDLVSLAIAIVAMSMSMSMTLAIVTIVLAIAVATILGCLLCPNLQALQSDPERVRGPKSIASGVLELAVKADCLDPEAILLIIRRRINRAEHIIDAPLKTTDRVLILARSIAVAVLAIILCCGGARE